MKKTPETLKLIITLWLTTKVQVKKVNWTISKLKIYVYQKTEQNRQCREWEIIYANNISDKELIFRYKRIFITSTKHFKTD